MNEIKTNIIEESLKYQNEVILKYKIEYPEIVSSDYRFGREIFNRYNKKIALDLQKYAKGELYQSARETYEYNKQNGYPIMVYEVYLVYKIAENTNQLISLYNDEYMFTGGAHGTTKRKAQTWDLKTARMLPLKYFYKYDEYYILNILKEINRQIKQQIEKGENYYFDNYCELVLETFDLNNFYVYKDYIEIFFQQYDIAPYSSGIPTFKIPY